MDKPTLNSQLKNRELIAAADELEVALSGARQQLRALRQSNEWEIPRKRRQFLHDLAARLRAILNQIELETIDD